MKYQLREFVCDGETTFQVWQAHIVSGWLRSTCRWEKLKEFSSWTAAQNYISKIGGGYYNSCHDYDERGRPIYYGW